MIFNSPSELKAQIMSRMQLAIQDAENIIHDTINQFLQKYYKEYDPKVYERTSQLLHSLVKSEIIQSGSGYQCHVYFDLDKIDYTYKYINGKRYKNSGYETTITKEEIVKMAMESETHGGYKAAENTAIWNESMKLLNRDKIEILRKCLTGKGIPIE